VGGTQLLSGGGRECEKLAKEPMKRTFRRKLQKENRGRLRGGKTKGLEHLLNVAIGITARDHQGQRLRIERAHGK